MLFSTPFFLFVFLPSFLVIYSLVRGRRQFLLAGSLFFYGWAEPKFIWIVLASAFFDYGLGLAIVRVRQNALQNWLVGIGVAANLSILVVVKYSAFAIRNFSTFIHPLADVHFFVPAFTLPLGISFIVFEKITYLVDLKRGIAKPARTPLDYLNFVFLFPKLLAGPIIKYHEIASQLRQPSHRYDDLRDGTIRFIQGLGKKVLVADALAPLVDSVFALPAAALDPGSAWLGLVAFSLQIYFDFSGYSDMAIGLARVLGFRLRENFNHPYIATSVTDFWRRWHISLSTWIKEYLYIPLGGSRVSPLRSYANLCICFVLSGLWHGASWNFLIWGCFHGIALVADRALWLRWQQRLPRLVNTGITLSWIMLTWVFFRCSTFEQATQFLAALGGRSATIQNTVVAQTDTLCIMLIGLAIVLAPLIHLRTRTAQADKRRVLALCGSFALLLVSIGRISVSTFHPFLYFRF